MVRDGCQHEQRGGTGRGGTRVPAPIEKELPILAELLEAVVGKLHHGVSGSASATASPSLRAGPIRSSSARPGRPAPPPGSGAPAPRPGRLRRVLTQDTRGG